MRAVVVAAMGLAVACQCGTDAERRVFACSTDDDCVQGQKCVASVCGGTAGSGGGTAGGGTAGGGAAGGTAGGAVATFSVSGTVVGLAGGPLVLRNNGGDALTLTANGAFEFPARLSDGSAYAVTLENPPGASGQRCLVQSGGSGTVAGANVTDVRVRCTLTVFGDGGFIIDHPISGCQTDGGTPLVTSLFVDAGFTVGSVSLTLHGLQHTWAGDILSFVAHGAGRSVFLFDRPPDGNCGSDRKYDGTYRFADDAGATVCTALAATDSGFTLASGDYAACTADGALSPLSAFTGDSVDGWWSLTVLDRGANDDGALRAWSLTLAPP